MFAVFLASGLKLPLCGDCKKVHVLHVLQKLREEKYLYDL